MAVRFVGVLALSLLFSSPVVYGDEFQSLATSETDATEEELLFLPLFPIEDIKQSLETWRAAWSNRDVTTFVSAYKPGYSSHKWMTHEDWVSRRWKNFGKHTFIDVQIEDVDIQAVDTLKYTAQFKQHYKSNTLSDKTIKKLTFEYLDEVWVITRVETIRKL